MAKQRGYRETIEQRVLNSIQENHLVSEQRRLLVAVSGGQDSVCLLQVLFKLQQELKAKLHVAHVNHQLRGTESDADAQYVAQLANQLNIPATIGRRDVKAYQAQHHTSSEEAAREVRYNFLAQVAGVIGTDRVAVAHTTDDHVETILMHLIRGTGNRGLQGLQPSSRWQSSGGSLTIIRPLLQVSRQETLEYCHNHELTPRVDASNLSLSPLRNRIRQQLLPLLQSYNPGVTEALLRTARLAGDTLAFLDNETDRLWGTVARTEGEAIVLDKQSFLELPRALQRHMLRAAIDRLLGNLKDIEMRHIDGIMAALVKPAGRKIDLPEGLVFSTGYNQYLLGPESAMLIPYPTLENEYDLKIPGETSLPGWYVKATITERKKINRKTESLIAACFDLDKTGDQLLVRCRQPGDRFQPLGMNQPKKLGEFMIDVKIPRAWRQRIPVVCSPQHILWVVGYRIDERLKVTENTRRVLCLDFKRVPDTNNSG